MVSSIPSSDATGARDLVSCVRRDRREWHARCVTGTVMTMPQVAVATMKLAQITKPGGEFPNRRHFLREAAMTIGAARLGMFTTADAAEREPRELAAIGRATRSEE